MVIWGEDLKGLCRASYRSSDAHGVYSDSDSDEEDAYLSMPAGLPADASADVFAMIPALCYGRRNEVDMLGLCGGKGGMPEFAFRRQLSSGGDLDKIAKVALGIPKVQRAVLHYLIFALFVKLSCNLAVRQLDCHRTSARGSSLRLDALAAPETCRA